MILHATLQDTTCDDTISGLIQDRGYADQICAQNRKGQPFAVEVSMEGQATPCLHVEVVPGARTISFAATKNGPAYLWKADDATYPEVFDKAAGYIFYLGRLFGCLPRTMPQYAPIFQHDGLAIMRNGALYAHLFFYVYKPAWSMHGTLALRGNIHGKPWTQPLMRASDIVNALIKREKIHAPVFAFRDRETQLYYARHEWPANTLSFVPQRSKARTFKRRSDASGHASWLAGVGELAAPTEKGWSDAYKHSEYDARGVLCTACPLPDTVDLIEIDKATKHETVLETAEEIAARITRRLALQRNVVARFGHASTAALDAAQEAGREDLDTLVLIHDPNGTIDVRGALKAAGVGGKKSLARKATYTTAYPPSPLITWSLAIPAKAKDALLSALPAGTRHGALTFQEALA